jgi:hypothetical protein
MGAPFHTVPKSGCRWSPRPIEFTNVFDCGCTGARDTSVFHGLSGGKIGHPGVPPAVGAGGGGGGAAVGAAVTGTGTAVGVTGRGVAGRGVGVGVFFACRAGFTLRVGVGVSPPLEDGVGLVAVAAITPRSSPPESPPPGTNTDALTTSTATAAPPNHNHAVRGGISLNRAT